MCHYFIKCSAFLNNTNAQKKPCAFQDVSCEMKNEQGIILIYCLHVPETPNQTFSKANHLVIFFQRLKPHAISWPATVINKSLLCFHELMVQTVKNSPTVQETWVRSLGWEEPVEEGIATHSSILAWRILMDRGAWLITVHGVSKSRTWLSD